MVDTIRIDVITALAVLLAAGITIVGLSANSHQNLEGVFKKWMIQHGKHYASSEEAYRFAVFKRNREYIKEHNELYREGIYSFTMVANAFADMSDQEYKATYLTLTRRYGINNRDVSITRVCKGTIPDTPNPPVSLDWSTKTATAVQTEGACGASWAFSATGALQALYAFSRGRILKVSDQQLLDCSQDYGNNGCDGGFMDQAFWYVIDNGIATAQQYPYMAKTSKCVYKYTMKLFSILDCAEVQPKNYSKLLSAVVQQPVAVAVDATNFRFYNDGVFDRACDTDLNRGMLLVGYGNLEGKDYWNLKNSQGTNWGRQGYILLARNKTDGLGPCGLQMDNFVPYSVVI